MEKMSSPEGEHLWEVGKFKRLKRALIDWASSRFRTRLTRIFFVNLFAVSYHVQSWAAEGPVGTCERAAATAAVETEVPLSVLSAIMLTETGREISGEFGPWPWTVNMEGNGHWFESKADALAYVNEHFQRGARSFDVGCFQINYKWHHENFSSVEEMFDPLISAMYAANFLKGLFREKGDWVAAAGAYHSRLPQFAEPYALRFSDNLVTVLRRKNLTVVPVMNTSEIARADQSMPQDPLLPNNYPLLRAGTSYGLGSLVPLGAGSASNILISDPDES